MKNGLKFLKDKEECVTESNLMVLNQRIYPQNEKKLYLTSASIIEEEKSGFLESTSKKQLIINNKYFYDSNQNIDENNLKTT